MIRIAVAAYGSSPPPRLASEAEAFVDSLPVNEVEILLGGFWGLMGVVCRRALERGIRVTAIVPFTDEEYEAPRGATIIFSGASPNMRSAVLVRSGDVLVALGGGAGTMMEALMAYRERKPVVALVGYGADSDEFFELAYKRGGFDSRNLSSILIARSGAEAARLALEAARK